MVIESSKRKIGLKTVGRGHKIRFLPRGFELRGTWRMLAQGLSAQPTRMVSVHGVKKIWVKKISNPEKFNNNRVLTLEGMVMLDE